MVIGAVEDQLIQRLRDAFGNRLREVDHKPARLDAEELARVLTQAPAAYVAFLGFSPEGRLPERTVMAAFGVFLVAANAAGDQARRRGAPQVIGAYEMVLLASAALEGWTPAAAAGPIALKGCENLFGLAFEKAGRSCYGLPLGIPIELPATPDAALLGDFVTFDVSWDIPPHGNVPRPPPSNPRDAGDRVTLPTS